MAAFAAESGESGLAPILRRSNRPIRVGVTGRRGTGCTTVTAALRAAGRTVVTGPVDATVLVVAETVKPEDLAHCGPNTLVVLNKQDLLGSALPAQLAAVRARTGRPTVPMNALLALASAAALDKSLVGALRVMAADPPDLSSTDAVTAGPHPVDAALRGRLLTLLDRFGIAALTAAVRAGADPASLPALMRELSGLDDVLGALDAVTAPQRYRRLQVALTEVRALAVRSGNGDLWALLASDRVVLAEMTAAAEVLRAAGLPVGANADARRWSRYGRGPLNALHRSCASALTRGSLRLAARR
ncbi:uncharacterized protein RMCC_6672 [Mycolicibacterium canariasense]|uniref:Uncharacterized protein n=1 Tax=Mycolicibacterium canariasense TaxID=228230 RepID=A0A117ICK8_MYCCR|nr:hypothetical protein [Mycolicibacterium canariasense]MCV7207597.1 hypothetical protein [Mycolicibacterium canariasense]ORV08825.1 hypothetical protein AWB94_11510 [Mycolicibacterium canariasense]GAS99707.1 uncharacterized protein RMCC_6672 [Mycolicibacterium canariasense]